MKQLATALAVSATMIGSVPVITAKAEPVAVPCSGTGLANCQFAFREAKGDRLLVQAEAEKAPTVGRKPVGFVFGSQDVRHATTPGRSVRLGEKVSRQTLTKRFAGYDVRYTKGEDCLTCAVISGADGHFVVSFARDGRTVVDIRSHDNRSRDTYGNAPGASLAKAVGSTSAQCDAGMDTTCASLNLKGLSYIVAGDDQCSIIVKEKQPTDIPACARIAGFQILAGDSAAVAPSKEVSFDRRQVRSAELSSLLRLFMLPTNSPNSEIPWETGSKGELPIAWKHAGLKDCDEHDMQWSASSLCRVGEIVLTLQGKVTHNVLGFRLEPGRWTVTILGEKGGGRYVLIDSAVNSGELEYSVIRFIGRQLSLTPIRKCETDGSVLYRAVAADKKPTFILESATCGTAGCAISLILGNSEDDMRGKMQSSCN